MGRPRGRWAQQRSRMCPQCGGGMQYDDEVWFCHFCGHSIPKDDGFTKDAAGSDDLDIEDKAIIDRVIKETEFSGS